MKTPSITRTTRRRMGAVALGMGLLFGAAACGNSEPATANDLLASWSLWEAPTQGDLMAFTQADLQSAASKLATLDFTAGELEAIASTIRGHGHASDAEVSGFVFEPNDEPLWAKGFIPQVAALVAKKPFTAPGDIAGLISMDEGEQI